MAFYFHTPDHIAADKAYNSGNYVLALQHYERALYTLNMHAASTLKLPAQFYYARAFVLGEIIITHCQLIHHSKTLDHSKINTTWQQIHSLLLELQQSCQHIKNKQKRETAIKKINQIYALLAQTCENISDDIVDAFDGKYEFTITEQPSLADALLWMERALNYQKMNRQSVALKFHLGYLHILEKQYKLTADTSLIEKMAHYIIQHHLVAEDIIKPLQKLELLSYVLRIAINNKNEREIAVLVNHCQVTLQTLNEGQKNSTIVKDILQLLGNDDVQDMEIGSSEPSTSNASLETDDIVGVTVQYNFSSIPESLLVLESIELTNSEEEQAESTALASEVDARTITPSATLLLNSLFLAGNMTTNYTSSEADKYTEAFLAAFKKVTEKANNHRFFANLLSLSADFFSPHNVMGLKSRTCLMIAKTLYQQALAIEPTHKAAFQGIETLQKSHPRLFADNKKFSQNSIPTGIFSPQVCDPRRPYRIDVLQERFHRNMKELVMELGAYFSASSETFKTTLDSLMQHLCQNIALKKIAGINSDEVAHLLFSAYADMTMEVTSNLGAPSCSQ